VSQFGGVGEVHLRGNESPVGLPGSIGGFLPALAHYVGDGLVVFLLSPAGLYQPSYLVRGAYAALIFAARECGKP
jgi:hypothetical protein